MDTKQLIADAEKLAARLEADSDRWVATDDRFDAFRLLRKLSAALPSDVAQAPVAWLVRWPNGQFDLFADEGEALGEAENFRAVPEPLYAAPVAAQALLTNEQRTTIQTAADTAHRVLCAGGDYGDELSDAGLRRDLKAARDALRALAAAPAQQAVTLPDAAREQAFEDFTAGYDLESSEWLDMDAQQTFVHGWDAAVEAFALAQGGTQ
ncbi:hypothetical protein [Paraburkholderia sp.]|uniref:hypothetical protein n=1 Tax=Paraburkholderia sp. TaxID=1926495 RepID=UPI0025FC88A2|nr:hypothetical protein [Paraburkholderia sp.]